MNTSPSRPPGPLAEKSNRCNCNLCERGRRYYRNTAKLPKTERDWMRGFYDAVLDEEYEAEMKKSQQNSD